MERGFGASQWNRWVQTMCAWFPERQIILRTDGRIRYLKISKRPQIFFCVLALAAIGWGGFTSITYFAIDGIIRGKNEQISNAHTNYRTLLNEVAEYQARFSLLTKELQKNHAMMLDLVETNATLQLNLQTTQSKLENTRRQQSEVVSARSALREKLTSIEGEMQTLNTKNFELRGNLSAVAKDLQNAMVERNKALDTNAKLKNQVAQLEQEIGRLHATESEVIQQMHKRTEEGIAFMERVFARAGLKTGEFLRDIASNARELVPAARDDEIETEQDAEQAEAQTSDAAEIQGDEAEIEPASGPAGTEMALVRIRASSVSGAIPSIIAGRCTTASICVRRYRPPSTPPRLESSHSPARRIHLADWSRSTTAWGSRHAMRTWVKSWFAWVRRSRYAKKSVSWARLDEAPGPTSITRYPTMADRSIPYAS